MVGTSHRSPSEVTVRVCAHANQVATTVGYGDLYPSSLAGKGLVALLGCVGVGLLGTLAAAALESWAEEHADKQSADRQAPSLRGTLREALLLLGTGVLGLRSLERLCWADAAYCALITLTTVSAPP